MTGEGCGIDHRVFQVLLVADAAARVSEIQADLAAAGAERFGVASAVGLENALVELSRGRYDALLLDASVGPVLEALSRVKLVTRDLPVVVLASSIDHEVALETVRMGAQDFLNVRALSPEELQDRICFAVERNGQLADLREDRSRAYRSSLHDPLTGLPNREHFLEQLDRALAYSERHGIEVGVLYLDLDRFKTMNDTLGHAVGDQLLIDVATRIRPMIRRSDLLSRLGGDEFGILVQDADPDGARTLARRVLETLRLPHEVQGREYWVTGSIGIAAGRGGQVDSAELIRNADAAMYEAKSLGKNQYARYSPRLGEVARRRIQLEHKLRRAFHGGRLEVHFQPLVDLRDGSIHGAEALLRWFDGELGNVSPAEFVPVAEENGLIVPLGHWVLEEACEQARRWHDDGFEDVPVTVNVSAVQIQREALRSSVIEALEKAQLPSNALHLEITESALMRDETLARKALGELRELGVALALDDFGTGYSSLANLRSFPVDAVKIDRSFVKDVTLDPGDAAIVAAILSMVQELGLRAVAEGVETEAQVDFLREHGCVEAQGFLFGAALPADAFLELLRRRRAELLIAPRR